MTAEEALLCIADLNLSWRNEEVAAILLAHRTSECRRGWADLLHEWNEKRQMLARGPDPAPDGQVFTYRSHLIRFCPFCGGRLPNHQVVAK